MKGGKVPMGQHRERCRVSRILAPPEEYKSPRGTPKRPPVGGRGASSCSRVLPRKGLMLLATLPALP
eukprot:scaffold1190_cov393-Prasinococcus_capsulatus_cf.AAC.45